MLIPNSSNDRPVSLNDRFPFHCSGCADCCRHVKGVVPLDAISLFRLTKYLRDNDVGVTCTNDVLCAFASPSMINDSGFFVYFLRAVEEDEHCVFLDGNRCSIQEVKPTACRMYPLQAAPGAEGQFQIVLSIERPHHFTGKKNKVKNWFYRNMSEDVREFYRYDFGMAPTINGLLKAVPDHHKEEALLLFHRYRYSDYDLGKPFLPQFRANTEKLISELELLAEDQRR